MNDTFFKDELEVFFDSLSRGAKTFIEELERGNTQSPLCNSYYDDDKFHMEIMLPGVTKEQVDLSYEDNKIILKAKTEVHDREYEMNEFKSFNFSRIFRLQRDIENIESIFLSNGILYLTIIFKVKKTVKVDIK